MDQQDSRRRRASVQQNLEPSFSVPGENAAGYETVNNGSASSSRNYGMPYGGNPSSGTYSGGYGAGGTSFSQGYSGAYVTQASYQGAGQKTGSANRSWYNAGPQPQQKAAARTKSTGKGTSSRKKTTVPPGGPRHTHWKLITALVLLGVLALAGVIGYSEITNKQKEVSRYDSVYLPGVYVDGIALGGMTKAQGEEAVRTHLQQKKDNWSVTLVAPNGVSKTITADALGIDWDPDAALSQAWSVGHSSYAGQFLLTALENKEKEINEAKSQEHHFTSAQQAADSQALEQILSSVEQAFYRAPQDAVFLGFDADNVDNPFSYQQEEWGQKLDTDSARQQIQALVDSLESGTVYLTTSVILPEVTVEDLSVDHQLRCRAITPISSHSSDDRTDNIRIAFSKINGLVIENGKKFSFNSVVGKRSIANGFHAAVEYVYGQETEGIGGGVCQASTTVYLASAQAGMTITKRVPHSMSVSYTSLGLDATVSDTKGHEIDFSFRNDSGYPIYITARVTSSATSKKNLVCEVCIYGHSLGNTRYELVAQTIETIPKPTEPTLVKDKQAQYVTYEDEQKTVAKGREGYVVESYLITYENDVEVSRELKYTDTYPAKADTVYVGVTKRGN